MQHNHSLEKLKSGPGAQTINYSALRFSEYVSNMADNQQRRELL